MDTSESEPEPNPRPTPVSVKRPVAVTIFLVVLGIFLVLLSVSLLFSLLRFGAGDILLEGVARKTLAHLVPLSLLGYTFWAVCKRKKSGRFLGLLFVAFMIFSSVYSQLNPPTGPGYYELKSEEEREGALFASVAMLIFLGWLFARFGFSRKSREYFGNYPVTPDHPQQTRSV